MKTDNDVIWLRDARIKDVPLVGGKNASLGEMIQNLSAGGILVPEGFATTASAYRRFLESNGLDREIRLILTNLAGGKIPLNEAGREIRRKIQRGVFPEAMEQSIRKYYRDLCSLYNMRDVDTAVRSSATAEDLPDASFAGQQETFLNVSGEEEVLDACKKCFASLYTDRAISYRETKGFDHMQAALSVGVQKMIRSDRAGSGVMFSIDTETGFPRVVVINAAWGLGENVVQGAVRPDEYRVFKPLIDIGTYRPIIQKDLGDKEIKMIYAAGRSAAVKNVETSRKERKMFVLSDDEILKLARWAAAIEKHYGRPMDMEWAKDGDSGLLYIVQARPETVQSRKDAALFRTYTLKEKANIIVEGLAIGEMISTGRAKVIHDAKDIALFETGAILVTRTTDPNWVPIMKRAAGIITDTGGRTSHAAIISRELGIPAVVGTEHATELIKDNQDITLSCAQGDRGVVYEGRLKFETHDLNLDDIPKTRTRINMNIANPAAAFQWWRLPSDGIGLARMEFIISNYIKVHPMALVKFDELTDLEAKKTIGDLTEFYTDRTDYFVERLALGIAMLAAPQYPNPVIVRMSDFKTNEYANLIGGKQFEPFEENPMIGFRGASRYYSDKYREGFALECRALKKVREVIGMTNVLTMIPFCRTLEEARNVLAEMAKNGLERGKDGLKVYVMCEIPSNVILADGFSKLFDGFSIGSNDLTQLVLGVDRDSAELAFLFNERNDAVTRMISSVIKTAHQEGREVGICGQAPSDYPEFAEFLVRAGIDSISLNPDKIIEMKKVIAKAEKDIGSEKAAAS